MSDRQVNIAIDAMGGENSPIKVLKGTEIFKKTKFKYYFFGNEQKIKNEIISNKIKLSNYNIINTTEDVTDDDNANIILRSRKIVVFIRFRVCKTNNSGFVSAGNTAAIMILSNY